MFRAEYGRAVAVLVRRLGSIDAAEDAVQDAFTLAVQRWSVDGLPPNPQGWIVTTARNRAIDRLRREAQRPAKYALVALASAPPAGAPNDLDGDSEDPVTDDRLRLISPAATQRSAARRRSP